MVVEKGPSVRSDLKTKGNRRHETRRTSLTWEATIRDLIRDSWVVTYWVYTRDLFMYDNYITHNLRWFLCLVNGTIRTRQTRLTWRRLDRPRSPGSNQEGRWNYRPVPTTRTSGTTSFSTREFSTPDPVHSVILLSDHSHDSPPPPVYGRKGRLLVRV